MKQSPSSFAELLAQAWAKKTSSPGLPAESERTLAAACACGDWEAARASALQGARGDDPEHARAFPALDISRRTMPLQAAAMHGREDLLRALLSNGAYPGACSAREARPPLLLALSHGHVGCAAALLEAGANPNARGLSSWGHCLAEDSEKYASATPLQEAVCALARGPAGRALLGRENSEPRQIFLTGPCPVKLLLAWGANPNARGARGRTALEVAIEAPGQLPLAALETLLGATDPPSPKALLRHGVVGAAIEADEPGRLLACESILRSLEPGPLFEKALAKAALASLVDLARLFGPGDDLLDQMARRQAQEALEQESGYGAAWAWRYLQEIQGGARQRWGAARGEIEAMLLKSSLGRSPQARPLGRL